jgi:transposase-like protein
MQRKGPRRDGAKERFWRRVVGRQGRSGRSVRDYCRQHGLSEPSFYAWRRELRRRGGRRVSPERRPAAGGANRRRAAPLPAKFVPVRVAEELVSPSAALELAFPSGAVLRWPAAFEPAAVVAVVSAWERLRC